ncbi:Mannosyltransferase [Pleurostoma richardsiae]|uniref:Mannosyltransferase n=1 Tax=Pleurostoma richardsiae TaxID=41990 RepID=A0AA38S314_9PEZI|nr:Mannosyltransferase [Pleurostoma richardsiae]
MKLLDLLFSFLLPAVVLVHLVVAPYSKVEESFNIQATHDVLVYGTPTSDISQKLTGSYDHFSFPGSVPRTFVGPVLLAGLSQPIVAVVGFEHAQFVVRALLGLFNAFALVFFKSQVHKAWGATTARWYAVLQASQFHVMFYASRTLPNMFAFGMTTAAFGLLLPTSNPRRVAPRLRLAVALFVFSAVIFRSEIALLLAVNAFYLLIIPSTSLNKLIPPFAVAFVAALLISVPIDSYFWQKPLWPELWGFYYNVVQGSSSNWGTSPWYYYFVSALPRLLLNPLAPFLILLSVTHAAFHRVAYRLVIPNLLFVAIYSLQPHKEARFIFYVVPPLTAAAALGATIVTTRSTKSPLYRAAFWAIVASIPLSFAASSAMLLVSSLNYPGGEALAHLRGVIRADADAPSAVPVHADVLSCMTGVTLFGAAMGPGLPTHNRPAGGGTVVGGTRGAGGAPGEIALDKTEDEAALRDPKFWTRFDYLLVEDAARLRPGDWELVGVAEGFAGVEVLRPGVASASGGHYEELGSKASTVGRTAALARVREWVRERLTGGYWVGPRTEPRVWILKRRKDAGGATREAIS